MWRFICTMNQPKFIDLNRVEVNSIQRVSIIQNKLIDFLSQVCIRTLYFIYIGHFQCGKTNGQRYFILCFGRFLLHLAYLTRRSNNYFN